MAGSLAGSAMTGSTWVKSSLSFANGNCVEVSDLPGGTIGVRNSRDREGPCPPIHPGRVACLPRRRPQGRVRRLRQDQDVEPRGPASRGERPVPGTSRPSPPPQTGGDGQARRAVGYPMTSVSLSSTGSRLGRDRSAGGHHQVTPGTAVIRPATAAAISTMTMPSPVKKPTCSSDAHDRAGAGRDRRPGSPWSRQRREDVAEGEPGTARDRQQRAEQRRRACSARPSSAARRAVRLPRGGSPGTAGRWCRSTPCPACTRS